MRFPAVHYHDYLQLDKLLTSQQPRSAELPQQRDAHDEMLFIITHQTYELWFRQILFELDSTLAIMAMTPVNHQGLATVVHRLERVKSIMGLMIQQVDILETMTPMDFLEFRDLLYPASGFQSVQFRLFENKLGLSPKARKPFNGTNYKAFVSSPQQKSLQDSEGAPNLFSAIQSWLERTPYIRAKSFDFWSAYQEAVVKMLDEDRQTLDEMTGMDSQQRDMAIMGIERTRQSFATIFNETEFEAARSEGKWRLSHRGLQGALFIQLYRDQVWLQMPHRLISVLLDIDEGLTLWRNRHAQMAQRMLGSKIGTGGSSGHNYLKDAADNHKVFTDFLNLSTFYIPRSRLPALPHEISTLLSAEPLPA